MCWRLELNCLGRSHNNKIINIAVAQLLCLKVGHLNIMEFHRWELKLHFNSHTAAYVRASGSVAYPRRWEVWTDPTPASLTHRQVKYT